MKNHKNAMKIRMPPNPEIIRTHLKAEGSSNRTIGMFIPNTPATTLKMAMTNVAVVSRSSN